MFVYAQLDENNICVGVSMLAGEVEAVDMIPLPMFDVDYVYRKFDHKTGQWSEQKYEPASTAPLDEFEQVKQRLKATEDALLALMLGGAS